MKIEQAFPVFRSEAFRGKTALKIRAVDRLNTEEINRRVSDVLADVIFCCTKRDVNNLHKEGYNPERI